MKRCVPVYFLALAFALLPGLPAQAHHLGIEHDTIDVSAFYNGSDVKVSGSITAGNQAVILVSGEPETLHLKRKGKVGGLFWMNAGDLTYENVPAVYMVYGPEGLESLLENSTLSFSTAALEGGVKISPENGDKATLFKEFVKLKEYEGVYAVRPGAVTTAADGSFETTLHIPPRMKPGTYSVTAFDLARDGVANMEETKLSIHQVGFPAFLTHMAYDRSLLYGILSVVIAVIAGLAMGVIFKGGGGGH